MVQAGAIHCQPGSALPIKYRMFSPLWPGIARAKDEGIEPEGGLKTLQLALSVFPEEAVKDFFVSVNTLGSSNFQGDWCFKTHCFFLKTSLVIAGLKLELEM
jgi:hypothetical protein